MEGQPKAPSAVKALVAALLAIFVCPLVGSILAIIWGNATMNEIHASNDALGGRFEGRFAQITGWLTLLFVPIAILAVMAVTFLGDAS